MLGKVSSIISGMVVCLEPLKKSPGLIVSSCSDELTEKLGNHRAKI